MKSHSFFCLSLLALLGQAGAAHAADQPSQPRKIVFVNGLSASDPSAVAQDTRKLVRQLQKAFPEASYTELSVDEIPSAANQLETGSITDLIILDDQSLLKTSSLKGVGQKMAEKSRVVIGYQEPELDSSLNREQKQAELSRLENEYLSELGLEHQNSAVRTKYLRDFSWGKAFWYNMLTYNVAGAFTLGAGFFVGLFIDPRVLDGLLISPLALEPLAILTAAMKAKEVRGDASGVAEAHKMLIPPRRPRTKVL